MPYFQISNFKPGLDTRRSELTSQPGTLDTLTDCHINQGGQIEKRKAITLVGNTTNCFGLVATSVGLMTFGSLSVAGVTVPGGVTYQQLIAPDGISGMTAVVMARCFGGLPFVIATFGAAGTFCYYNGQLVADFVAGLVLPYLTTYTSVVQEIASLVNNTSDYTAISNGTEMDLLGIPGRSYNVEVITESLSGFNITTGSNTTYPTAVLASAQETNPSNGQTIFIGGKTYTFVSVLSAVEGQVLIGTNVYQTISYLYNAVNHGTGYNNTYYCAAANANVIASLLSLAKYPSFTLTARTLNTSGAVENLIPGLSFVNEAPTTTPTQGAQAQGQFQIVAGVPSSSTVVTGVLSSNGATQPSGTSENVFIYTGLTGHGTSLAHYTFVASLSTAGVSNVSGGDWDINVLIGVDVQTTLNNLYLAIMAQGTPGVNYSGITTWNTGQIIANLSVTAAAPVLISGSTYGITLSMLPTLFIISIVPDDPDMFGDTTGFTFTPTGGAPVSGNNTAYLTIVGASQLTAITVGPVAASGQIAFSGTNLSNNDTIIIGSTLYTFVTTLPGTPAEGSVLIGSVIQDTLQNLIAAINQTGIYGVNYQVSSLNTQASALPSTQGGVYKIIARFPGSAGNAISMSTSSAYLTVSATLTGGADTVSLIPYPVIWTSQQTIQQFANSVASAISSYQGSSGFYAQNRNQTIFIYATSFNSYTNNANISVTAVGICCGFLGLIFSIGAQTSTASLSTLTFNGISLITGAAAFLTTIPALVTAIANDINSNTTGGVNTTWLAVADGNILYLSNIVTTNNDPSQTLTYSVDSNSYLGVGSVGTNSMIASVSPTSVNFTRNNNITATFSPVIVTCSVIGGYPPYTYSWQFANGATGFYVSSPTAQSVQFYRNDTAGSDLTAWVCVVTDSQGNSATSNGVTVYQP